VQFAEGIVLPFGVGRPNSERRCAHTSTLRASADGGARPALHRTHPA
jgi:hypothetical protein